MRMLKYLIILLSINAFSQGIKGINGINGKWCNKGEVLSLHEFQKTPVRLEPYCVELKVIKETGTNIGVGHWIANWAFIQSVPAKMHPLQKKQKTGSQGTESPGIFSYQRLADGTISIKMLSIINEMSSADLVLFKDGSMTMNALKYPQNRNANQAYVVAAQLEKRSENTSDFSQRWQRIYTSGQKAAQSELIDE